MRSRTSNLPALRMLFARRGTATAGIALQLGAQLRHQGLHGSTIGREFAGSKVES